MITSRSLSARLRSHCRAWFKTMGPSLPQQDFGAVNQEAQMQAVNVFWLGLQTRECVDGESGGGCMSPGGEPSVDQIFVLASVVMALARTLGRFFHAGTSRSADALVLLGSTTCRLLLRLADALLPLALSLAGALASAFLLVGLVGLGVLWRACDKKDGALVACHVAFGKGQCPRRLETGCTMKRGCISVSVKGPDDGGEMAGRTQKEQAENSKLGHLVDMRSGEFAMLNREKGVTRPASEVEGGGGRTRSAERGPRSVFMPC